MENNKKSLDDWQDVPVDDWQEVPIAQVDDWEDVSAETPQKSGLIKQALKGATTPFSGFYESPEEAQAKEKEYSPEAIESAKSLLKDKGFEKDSWTDAAWTGILGFADTLTGGNQAEIMAKGKQLEDFFGINPSGKDYEELRDMYEAAYEIRSAAQPMSALAGELGGYFGGAGALAKSAAGLGAGKALAAGGLGATTQSALVASDRAKEGQEVEAVARDITESALGAAAVGGLAKAAGLFKTGAKAAKDKAVQMLEKSGYDSDQAERIGRAFEEERALLEDTNITIKGLSPEDRKEFKEVILNNVPLHELEKYGDMDNAISQFKDLKARKAATLKEAGLDPKKSNRIATFIVDGQYAGDMIDRRWGTNFMRNMNGLSDDTNKATHLSSSLKTQAKEVLDRFRPKDIKDSERIIKDVESGVDSPEANAYRQLFRNMATSVNQFTKDAGYMNKDMFSLKEISNYIPHYTKRPEVAVATLRKRVEDTLGGKPVKLGEKELTKLAQDQELVDSLVYIGGMAGRKKIPDNYLEKAVSDLYGSSVLKVPDSFTDLGAASIRTRKLDKVPDLIAEKDLGLLLGGWADSVPMDILTRKNARKIRVEAEAIKDKDPEAYKYMTGYLNSLGGIKQGIDSYTNAMSKAFATKQYQSFLKNQKISEQLKAQGDKLGAWQAGLKAKMAKASAEIPEFMQMAQNQMYPAFLGLRPEANLRNLTQPYVYTIQQVSKDPRYQAKLAGSGVLNTLGNQFGATKSQLKELADLGMSPADPTPGAFMEMRRGLESSPGLARRMGKKALEKTNHWAMYLYQQSDIANRLVTLNMAKTVTKDALKGDKNAIKYINNLPSSYRRDAVRLVKEGLDGEESPELLRLIAGHLNSTTQFNYNQASMSEYGRTMGKLFTMFTKWPTAIMGDIINTIDASKLKQAQRQSVLDGATATLANKYLGPLLALNAFDIAATGATNSQITNALLDLEKEDSPIRDFFIPRSGLSSSAPITSATGLFSAPERSIVPPVFNAISDAYNLEFDSTLGLVPGYVHGRFVSERLPLLTGERGQKLPERIKEMTGLE